MNFSRRSFLQTTAVAAITLAGEKPTPAGKSPLAGEVGITKDANDS